MIGSVHHDVVGMLHSRGERDDLFTKISGGLVDGVASQKHLVVISHLILNEPVFRWISVNPLRFTMNTSPV